MSSDFVDYVNELLAPLGSVRSKRMFGGVGIYINDYFCALIADDCLYFKGDDDNEAEFAASKCPPFTYEKGGIVHAMRYYRAPDEAMDNPMEMARWARLGLAAAMRKAVAPKPKSKRTPLGASPKSRPTRLG